MLPTDPHDKRQNRIILLGVCAALFIIGFGFVMLLVELAR